MQPFAHPARPCPAPSARVPWFLPVLLLIGALLCAVPVLADPPTPFVLTESVNTPVGAGQGIFPGRVTFVRDTTANSWDGTGFWWNAPVDQAKVNAMASKSVQWLTGTTTDEDAWDALFRSFNNTHGRGNYGYQSGEVIAIKCNLVCSSGHRTVRTEPDSWYSYDIDSFDKGAEQSDLAPNGSETSAHALYAMLDQLVNHAGVPQNMIYVYDSLRIIPDNMYDYCHADFPDVNYASVTVEPALLAGERIPITPTTTFPIKWSSGGGSDNVPTFVDAATYMISLPALKTHGSNAGLTMSAKNHYGSLCRQPWQTGLSDSGPTIPEWRDIHSTLPNGDWNGPKLLATYGQYRHLTDIIGSSALGQKTMLHFIDGLWGGSDWGDTPALWSYFGNDWPSCFIASQDPVAVDSVGMDFLRQVFADHMWPACDDYLHEAAQANNPPSGTVYDPDGIGGGYRLPSLGVHEHWNNATDRLYTRNLGTDDGIELVESRTPVSLITSPVNAGDPVLAQVQLDAQGVEKRVSGTIAFDATKLTYDSAVLGADAAGCTLTLDTALAGTGKLGFTVSKSTGVFAAGVKTILEVNLTAASVAEATDTTLSFTDQAVDRAVQGSLNNYLCALFTGTTLTITPVPLTDVTLEASPTSPQVVNTPITLTATAVGGGSVQYQFWGSTDGGANWTMLRNFNTTDYITWSPALEDTTYQLKVVARDGFSGPTVESDPLSFVVTPPTFNVSLNGTPSPGAITAGTPITLTATAFGGGASKTYTFKMSRDAGTTWCIIGTPGSSNILTWTPSVAGTYSLKAQVVSGSLVAESSEIGYIITAVSNGSTLNASPAAPRPVNTTITLSGTKPSGYGSVRYKFLASADGGVTWVTVRDFSLSSSASWRPTKAGIYQLRMQVRETGSGRVAEAPGKSYEIVAALSSVTVTPSPVSPRPRNTTITLTAAKTGGVNVLYTYQVYINGAWSTLGTAKTTATTQNWTPNAAGTYYLRVQAREGTNGATVTSPTVKFIVTT